MSDLESLIQSLMSAYSHEEPTKFKFDVYHYTSTNNLPNILLSKQQLHNSPQMRSIVRLRLSDVRCLNDYSENSEAYSHFRSVCTSLLQSKHISMEFFDLISSVESSYHTFSYNNHSAFEEGFCDPNLGYLEMPTNRFVCCFSRVDDLLPMWNYYLRNSKYEGYSIGIKLDELDTALEQFSRSRCKAYIVEMIYDDMEKDFQIKDSIERLFDKWDRCSVASEQICDAVTRLLWNWNLYFKNPAFAYEQEIRLVVDVPKDIVTGEKMEFSDSPMIKINYLSRNGLLIPYFELDFDVSIFSTLTVGPFTNNQIDKGVQREILNRFLQQHGFNIHPKRTVRFSNAPIRF